MSVCGVLLTDAGLAELGDAIKPYLQEGPAGNFIYCAQAVQNGNFIDMTFEPGQADGSVVEGMVVSIPLGFVKFMVTGVKSLPIGFGTQSSE